MDLTTHIEYFSAGGNRHPSAGDQHSASGLICYASGRNLVLWSIRQLDQHIRSEQVLITTAHTDVVNAVKFVPSAFTAFPIIISASADGTLRIWRSTTRKTQDFACIRTIDAHRGTINCLAVSESSGLIVSGATDGTVKVWRLDVDSTNTLLSIQTIVLPTRCFPLAISLHPLNSDRGIVLAVGGTRKTVDIYVSNAPRSNCLFSWQTSLSGHDGWIRSLDFICADTTPETDVLLATASQDKYIRLWRFHKNSNEGTLPQQSLQFGELKALSNKSHRLELDSSSFTVTFEALLLGHEDWVYSVHWDKHSTCLRLLSASADNSLVIWEPEVSSGIWICKDRLGEVSVQKGSTTATGSTGGFWTGLWCNGGNSIVALGRTGSWRRWIFTEADGRWALVESISGHTGEVRDISWSPSGAYLLSTSADQTTRVHARLEAAPTSFWSELARPQIHGYDLNCVAAISNWQYVSGADEKLLRVFDAPAPFATSLKSLYSGVSSEDRRLPQVAAVPVLGLSNKEAVVPAEDDPTGDDGVFGLESHYSSAEVKSEIATGWPPSEDFLSRHTLWPEREKLYGHGFEISALAASHDGSIIASACKASSSEHAVIRVYDTSSWLEVKPTLGAHSLTVTSLDFSDDDRFLVSGGRDRKWCVFEYKKKISPGFSIYASNTKGHSRMILDVAWLAGSPRDAFATAGRDKCVKIWAREDKNFICCSTITSVAPVSSVNFCTLREQQALLAACGLDTGAVFVHTLDSASYEILRTVQLFEALSPPLSINCVKWQPNQSIEWSDTQKELHRLAIASQNNAVMIVKPLFAPR